MNIFDMPFLAAGPFPTNSVENGGGRAGKNRENLPGPGEAGRRVEAGDPRERSPALAAKRTSVRNEMREGREKLGEVRGEK